MQLDVRLLSHDHDPNIANSLNGPFQPHTQATCDSTGSFPTPSTPQWRYALYPLPVSHPSGQSLKPIHPPQLPYQAIMPSFLTTSFAGHSSPWLESGRIDRSRPVAVVSIPSSSSMLDRQTVVSTSLWLSSRFPSPYSAAQTAESRPTGRGYTRHFPHSPHRASTRDYPFLSLLPPLPLTYSNPPTDARGVLPSVASKGLLTVFTPFLCPTLPCVHPPRRQ